MNDVPGALPQSDWYRSIPIAVLSRYYARPRTVFPLFAGLAIAQSALMWLTYRDSLAAAESRGRRLGTIVAVAIMAIAAIVSPVAKSSDVYAYVGYGLAPSYHDSIDTELYRLPKGFSAIHAIYGDPLVPNVYGPTWYLISSFVRVLRAPLSVDVYVFRGLAAAASLAIYRLLRKHLSARLALMAALCPALYDQWILDAHNDVFAVLAVAASLVLVKRSSIAAVVLAVLATTIKISALPVALTVVALLPSLRSRLTMAGTIVAGAVVVFFLFDGRTYYAVNVAHLQTMQGIGPTLRHHVPKLERLLEATIAIVVALAIVARRVSGGYAYVFIAIKQRLYPWYLTWGLPYAALSGESFAAFCISLPTLTALGTAEIAYGYPHELLFLVVPFAIALSATATRRVVLAS